MNEKYQGNEKKNKSSVKRYLLEMVEFKQKDE